MALILSVWIFIFVNFGLSASQDIVFDQQETGNFAEQEIGNFAEQETGSFAEQETGNFAEQETGAFAEQENFQNKEMYVLKILYLIKRAFGNVIIVLQCKFVFY